MSHSFWLGRTNCPIHICPKRTLTCIETYSTFQHDTFKWLLLVHHQLLLPKCEPSQERKQILCQDHADCNNPTVHEGPPIVSESSGFKCIQLVSQIFAELPLLNENFQTKYNPMNLSISTSEIYRLF